MALNTKYEGTGSMKGFVASSVALFKAINEAKVEVPKNYAGAEPTLSIKDSDKDPKLVLDMAEALLFTLNNVSWDLSGTATFVSTDVTVNNGKLIISVTANS